MSLSKNENTSVISQHFPQNFPYRQCLWLVDFFGSFKGSCIHHDGFIYDNASADMAYHSLADATLFLSKIESDAINNPDRREEIEREKTKFKWICCDATLQSGGGATAGCKKGKHGFNPENQRSQQHQQQRQRQLVQRLEDDMIIEWEMACREVYNNRWIELMRYRN